MKLSDFPGHGIAIALIALTLSGCADMPSGPSKVQREMDALERQRIERVSHTPANKDPQFHEKLTRVSVWTHIGNIAYHNGLFKDAFRPFPDVFAPVLAEEFKKNGVAAAVNEVPQLGQSDTGDQLAISERDLPDPQVRLLVQPRTVRGNRDGAAVVVYDLSLFSMRTKQRVWRTELVVESVFEIPAWSESTARRFASDMMLLMKRDGLI